MVEAGSEEEVSFRKYRTPEVTSGQSPPLPLRTYPEPMSWPEKGEGRRWKRKQCYRAGHTNNQNGSRCVCLLRGTDCILLGFKALSSVWQQTATGHTILLLCIQDLSLLIGCLDSFCSFPQVLCADAGTLSKMKPRPLFMWFPSHYLLIILPFDCVQRCATWRLAGGAEV